MYAWYMHRVLPALACWLRNRVAGRSSVANGDRMAAPSAQYALCGDGSPCRCGAVARAPARPVQPRQQLARNLQPAPAAHSVEVEMALRRPGTG
ncbi:hypothetical protein DZD52_03035 [Xanthomonas nasturtii]|uniref:Uncharacterized protein n=1 Tax=Xanthomonas nasturtii TaxID=1843581 RepID=A0A3E1KQS4_9XANT|nr:hypothetical protein DZD52_03035 [Xanthomonas nasturtii]